MFYYRNGRCTGVEYQWNAVSGNEDTTSLNIVEASKIVVLAGGAFGSPAILERSGIGSAAVLERAGISQVVELAGVGEAYQGKVPFLIIILTDADTCSDHNIVFTPYIADPETETLDAILRNETDEISCAPHVMCCCLRQLTMI